MIHQLDIYGKDKVQKAIEIIRFFEPSDGSGYWMAFSGGKDSVVVKALMDMAGVKYETHYQVTTVDPPELIRFIKQTYPDVIFDHSRYDDGTPKTIHDQDRKSFPLVPVPDHGDLIDRDELAHEMWLKFCENCIRAGEDMCNFCTDKQYIDLIVNYPATISAERSEA